MAYFPSISSSHPLNFHITPTHVIDLEMSPAEVQPNAFASTPGYLNGGLAVVDNFDARPQTLVSPMEPAGEHFDRISSDRREGNNDNEFDLFGTEQVDGDGDGNMGVEEERDFEEQSGPQNSLKFSMGGTTFTMNTMDDDDLGF